MTRQYTFKTTKNTKWIEPILDELSKDRERSAVIRDIIIEYLEKSGLREALEEELNKDSSVDTEDSNGRHPLVHRMLVARSLPNKSDFSQTKKHEVPQSNTTSEEVSPPDDLFSDVSDIEPDDIDLDSALDNISFD